jgi:hypothetical protein
LADDVQGILDRLDDGIVWKGVYGAGAHVPTAGERRGKAQDSADFAMVFTMRSGKVTAFQEFTDSASSRRSSPRHSVQRFNIEAEGTMTGFGGDVCRTSASRSHRRARRRERERGIQCEITPEGPVSDAWIA